VIDPAKPEGTTGGAKNPAKAKAVAVIVVGATNESGTSIHAEHPEAALSLAHAMKTVSEQILRDAKQLRLSPPGKPQEATAVVSGSGQLGLTLSADHNKGRVMLKLRKSANWVSFLPKAAEDLAVGLLKYAAELRANGHR